jgi:hypothetical protein
MTSVPATILALDIQNETNAMGSCRDWSCRCDRKGYMPSLWGLRAMVPLVANCVYDTSGGYIRRVAEGEHDQKRKAIQLRGSGNLMQYFLFLCSSIELVFSRMVDVSFICFSYARICFRMAGKCYLSQRRSCSNTSTLFPFLFGGSQRPPKLRTHTALSFNSTNTFSSTSGTKLQYNPRFPRSRYTHCD